MAKKKLRDKRTYTRGSVRWERCVLTGGGGAPGGYDARLASPLVCMAATVADAETICALDMADIVCNAFSLAACSVGTTYSPTTHVTLYL